LEKVYIVTYDGKISSESYITIEKAINFIENRNGNPKRIFGWEWEDEDYKLYKIKEINIK
jgi:hypothetical protein